MIISWFKQPSIDSCTLLHTLSIQVIAARILLRFKLELLVSNPITAESGWHLSGTVSFFGYCPASDCMQVFSCLFSTDIIREVEVFDSDSYCKYRSHPHSIHTKGRAFYHVFLKTAELF